MLIRRDRCVIQLVSNELSNLRANDLNSVGGAQPTHANGIFTSPSTTLSARTTLNGSSGGRKVEGKKPEFTDRVLPPDPIMSRANGWLRGTTVRKGGAATNNQRPNQGHVVSTSSTIFGGGVKDPSGRTSEYFVRRTRRTQMVTR